MRLTGHTSGAYEGHKLSMEQRNAPPLDHAFLQIQQTRAMLELVRHAEKHGPLQRSGKEIYDHNGFGAIATELENMLPEYRAGSGNVLRSAQKLLETNGSRSAMQQAAQIGHVAAAHEVALIDSYHLIMESIRDQLARTIDAIPPETIPDAIKDSDWLESAKTHSAAAVELLQQAISERGQEPEAKRATR